MGAPSRGPLLVPVSLIRAMWDHAREDAPLEACGVLPGVRGAGPSRWVPMVNVERSATWFRFDRDAQLRLWREMDARGEYPAVVYHSHPTSGPEPSQTDVDHMWDPQSAYVILSLPQERLAAFRRVPQGGVVAEISIQIIDTGLDTRCVVW